MSTEKNVRKQEPYLTTPAVSSNAESGGEGIDKFGRHSPDQIGGLIREKRLSLGLSVRGMARQIGVSPSLISQIELGRVRPSVDTLYKIANDLGIYFDTLFSNSEHSRGALESSAAEHDAAGPVSRPQGLVRREQHRRIRLAGGIEWELLTPAPDPNMEFLRVVYEPGAASCPKDALIRHGGFEYAYLISGRLGVQVGFDEHELLPGDSVSFQADIPHRLWAIGEENAVAIWVVVNRKNDSRRTGI